MQRPEWFIQGAEAVATAIEGVGIVIVLLGALFALAGYARALLKAAKVKASARTTSETLSGANASSETAYRDLRRRLGRAILLGLEFLVAADIIGTVLVSPTLANAAALGVVVLIRTFLSFSLELEIEGRWPWQRDSAGPRIAPTA